MNSRDKAKLAIAFRLIYEHNEQHSFLMTRLARLAHEVMIGSRPANELDLALNQLRDKLAADNNAMFKANKGSAVRYSKTKAG